MNVKEYLTDLMIGTAQKTKEVIHNEDVESTKKATTELLKETKEIKAEIKKHKKEKPKDAILQSVLKDLSYQLGVIENTLKSHKKRIPRKTPAKSEPAKRKAVVKPRKPKIEVDPVETTEIEDPEVPIQKVETEVQKNTVFDEPVIEPPKNIRKRYALKPM